MTLYTVRTRRTDSFLISKLSEELEVLDSYVIRKHRNALTCSCMSHKPYCKHMDILEIFEKNKKINTGSFYDFEKSKWEPPVSYE